MLDSKKIDCSVRKKNKGEIMLPQIQNLVYNKSRKTAFIENDKRTTFLTLSKKSMLIAEKLNTFKEDKVVIFLPDSSDFVFALCGTLMSGKTAFPINTNYTVSEINSLLTFVKPAVVTSKKFQEIFESFIKESKNPLNIVYIEDIYQKNFPKKFKLHKKKRRKPILFLNTSGTSGKPKIVMLNENNISSCVDGYLEKINFQVLKGNKYILASPFSSAYGLMVIFACLKINFALVLLKNPFNIINFLQTAQINKVTFFEGGTPVLLMLWQICKTNPQFQINYPIYYGFGGSKISSLALKELKNSHPHFSFWPGYGMTEASPLISKFKIYYDNQNFDSVGTAIQGETIKISNKNKLTTDPNTIGEIAVKGKNIMIGYYKNKKETKKIIRKGFLFTGDMGYFDENKNLYIIGRKKNIIIVKGLNVSIEEVECTILDSGFAKDCMVYSVHDKFGNEEICADIIPMSKNIDKQTIINFCKTNLANYKVPKQINFVEKINKTVSGKNFIGKTK